MERVTKSHLASLAKIINREAGTPLEPYAYTQETKVRANRGCFHITQPYGGRFALECITDDSGATRTVIPAKPKRELYHAMSAFLDGMQECARLRDVKARG